MRRLLVPSLLVIAVVAIAGCGGDDDDGTSDTDPSSDGAGELFTQNTQQGSLTPVGGKSDVFTLRFEQPAPDVTVFTDRPARSASTESLSEFVERWDERGFGQDPPNAALVLDQEPDDADTAVFTLTDPSYDQASGAVSYTATHISGGSSSLPSDEDIDPPASFGDAHLFIDPSGTGDVHEIAVDVTGQKLDAHVTISFDSPWTVFVGSGAQGIGYLVGPNTTGGGAVEPSSVELRSNGSVEFALQGGTGAITGTANFATGRVGIQVDDNPEQTIKSGSFSLSP